MYRMLVGHRQSASADEDTMYVYCLLIHHQQVLFATFIVYPDSRPRQFSQCRLQTSDMKQPTTDWTRLRCHYKMLCTRYYSYCTVSPLSTVMWNSVDIGQRIIYSWICQNCTSQHLAIPSASTPPRLLYKQGAVVSPVSLQTFATLRMQKYSLIYLFYYISTYNQHYYYYWLHLLAVDADILYCNVKVTSIYLDILSNTVTTAPHCCSATIVAMPSSAAACIC